MEMVVMELRVLERNSRLEIGQRALRKLLEYGSTIRVFQRCNEETWRRKSGSWTGVQQTGFIGWEPSVEEAKALFTPHTCSPLLRSPTGFCSPLLRLPHHSDNWPTVRPGWLQQRQQHLLPANNLGESWSHDYHTDRPQHIGLKDIMSDTMVSCTGAPQDTVLAPLLFTLYTRHIQKYADDTAIVGCIKDDGVEEYWRLVGGFVAWCRMNHLQLNTSKTKGRSSSFPSAGPAGSRTPLSIVPSQPATPHWGRGHRVHRTAEGVGGGILHLLV